MATRRHRHGEQDHDDQQRSGADVAPGKRTLTSSLPPPRDTVSFDRSSDYMESRATIDGTPTTSRLTDRQLRKACERNVHWQNKLGFSTSLFGGGAIDTGEFADNVAEKQAAHGLPIDGIAGPSTLGAVIRGTSGPDDPFATHLLGMTQGAGGEKSRATGSGSGSRSRTRSTAAKTPAKTPTETRIRAEITDIQPKDDGVQLVIGAGATNGVDASWYVHVLGCQLEWKVVDVRENSIVVVSRRGQIDDVLGLTDVDLKGVPRETSQTEAEAESDDEANDAATTGAVTGASATDEPAWWTFED
ncbi:MAG TPA: peptidoglycan-binding domain-containing protein [Kofleriaceae bacterium]|nr:peptidoglycan-binding domain-containing protein [Kofleriaceae bacterium]